MSKRRIIDRGPMKNTVRSLRYRFMIIMGSAERIPIHQIMEFGELLSHIEG